MHSAKSSPRRSADTRLAAWVVVAVAAHALLLLAPSQRDLQSRHELRSLAVSIVRPALRLPAAAVPAPAPAPASTVPSPPRSAADPIQSAVPAAPPEQVAEQSLQTPREQPAPSAAYLLDLAGRREWRLPEPTGAPDLGRFVPKTPPPYWRPDTAQEPDRFDGMAAPAEVEIVDRWLAADGSHNVVVTATDGATYCGRAEVWDPMNPMVEHLMMWRPCGGGGKRTFDMPHSFREGPGGADRR